MPKGQTGLNELFSLYAIDEIKLYHKLQKIHIVD